MRTRKIAQLEKKRNSRVMLLVHRQESMRFLGFPLVRYIDINDSEEVLRAIQMTDGEVPPDMWFFTLPGGLVLAALQIAQAVRDHKSNVTVFVPHYAMSGGTLVALAANEIVMCKHSVLDAIDPQLGDSPAASMLKVVRTEARGGNRRTDVRADIGRKAIAQVKQAAAGLLQRTLTTDRAEALAEKLATGTWTHDYPIWATTAKELGLPVRTDMPNEVLDLMSVYPQPVRAQGGGGSGTCRRPGKRKPERRTLGGRHDPLGCRRKGPALMRLEKC
jgi:ClpP class serine protease